MPSVSLSSIKEFHIDLLNTLHRATILQVKLKQREECAKNLERLDSITNMNGILCSGLDEDSELTVSDASAISKEKEEKFHDVQQFRSELGEILDSLQGHYETPLESFLSVDDDDGKSMQHHGQRLMSWAESIRGQLIEISRRTRVILEEKEERKKKWKEESKLIQEMLDQMTMLQAYVIKTDNKLNDVAQMTSGEDKPIPKLSNEMDVDSDPQANWENNFTILLEDTKTDLRVFHASQLTYAAKADSLHSQILKVFHNAASGHPIIPVRNVKIDPIELDSAIRQIVVEEFRSLYGHFFSSLTEETGKRGGEAMSSLTKTMAHGNKLACEILATYFNGVEGGLNGRSDHPKSGAVTSP